MSENENESGQGTYFEPPRERRESDSGKFSIQDKFLQLKHQRKDKIIHASEDVLSSYHKSYPYGKIVSSIKVQAAIWGGKWSPLLMWVESLVSLILVSLYVRSTYASWDDHVIKVLRIICSICFVVEYFVKLYSAPVQLYYFVSFTGIVDVIEFSIFPDTESMERRRCYTIACIDLMLLKNHPLSGIRGACWEYH